MKIKTNRYFSAEIVTRDATVTSNNTIDVIWSTGSRGIRHSPQGSYYEELSMEPSAVDLTRLNKGAPFLNEHDPTINSTLGVVERAEINNGVANATIKLSSNPNVSGIVQDIKDGILKNISVGYRVLSAEQVGTENNLPVIRVTSWSPMELSLVAIPFDENAQVLRSDSESNIEESFLEIINEKERTMSNESTTIVQEEVTEQTQEDNSELLQEEEQRKAQVTTMCLSAQLNETETKEILTRALTIEEASQLIFKTLEQKQEKQNAQQEQKKEERKMNKKEMLEEALLNRINARNFKVSAENPYKQFSLLDIAKEVVERKANESEMSFAQRAITSSDLASLLQNVANKVLVENGQEKYNYRKIAQEIPLRDFKATPVVRIANSGLSDKGSEAGDYTSATLTNSGESITLKDRGQLFVISYKALMNDDIGELKNIANKADDMGKKDIEKQMMALLNSNPTMSDSKTLFHADHNNLIAAGEAPSVASVDIANQKMRAFTDESGENMDLTIKYLIVPPKYELNAKQVAGAMIATASSDLNPFAGNIEVIVSGRITGDVWYAACDPQEFSSLVFGTLEGQSDQASVEAEEDFNSKSLKVRVTQPSCVGAASYKGIVKTVVA